MSEQVYTNCTNAGPISVYVKDGNVVRIRPLVADENDFTPWTINADGKTYTSPKKFALSPYIHGERVRETEFEYYKEHAPALAHDPPASTVCQVVSLSKENMLVEFDIIALRS
jgi:enamine deaminase RidA (YjgF/YER057c/UK114 family)